MKFCDKCGNMLVVVTIEHEKFLVCKRCNLKLPLKENFALTSTNENKEKVLVIDSEESVFPVARVLCPKCQAMEDAEWTLQQTRAADEPPTRFYRCKKCNWVLREYS